MTDSFNIRVKVTQGPPIRVTTITDDLTGVPFPAHEDFVNVEAAKLTDVDFTRHTFKPFNAIGATFERCLFRRTTFGNGSFGGQRDDIMQSRYIDCTFDGNRIGPYMWPGNARFERCRFIGTKIKGWRSFHAEFVDCSFSGELSDCWFTGTTYMSQFPLREHNEFRGNDFSQASLVDCQFDYGIDLLDQRWPDGPDYLVLDRIHERVRAARAVVSRWPDDFEREYALGRLSDMTTDGMLTQDVYLFRRSRWLRRTPAIRDKLLALLEQAPGP